MKTEETTDQDVCSAYAEVEGSEGFAEEVLATRWPDCPDKVIWGVTGQVFGSEPMGAQEGRHDTSQNARWV